MMVQLHRGLLRMSFSEQCCVKEPRERHPKLPPQPHSRKLVPGSYAYDAEEVSLFFLDLKVQRVVQRNGRGLKSLRYVKQQYLCRLIQKMSRYDHFKDLACTDYLRYLRCNSSLLFLVYKNVQTVCKAISCHSNAT